jgi:hypothetical protein
VWLTACSSVSRVAGNLGDLVGSDVIQIKVEPSPGSPAVLRSGQPLRLLLIDPKDQRPLANARQAGKIRATVSDMHSTELILDQDVAQLAGSALRRQLTSEGFTLVTPGQAHDFELSPVVRTFELNIGGRDELDLSLELGLRAEGSGEVVWAGIVSEKTDRFAGVSGNSQRTITSYLSEGLGKLIQRSAATVKTSLLQSYPQTMTTGNIIAAPVATPGITTLTPVRVKDSAATTSAPAANPQPMVPAPTATGVNATAPLVPAQPKPMAAPAPSRSQTVLSDVLPGYGYFLVNTNPTRVKVYSDGIYYGLTPLKVMVPVGVMTFEFRFDGYKTATEKISVRNGETTELELKLKK